jgi:glycosyltransferase involved in cell wall biosynthesis
VKILALATHPIEVASTRHRVLAYLPMLEARGHQVEFQAFFPSAALPTIYGPGRQLQKLYWVLRGALDRSIGLRSRRWDLVFIHREIFPLGRTFFLSQLTRRNVRIVYDYDDALFLPQRADRGLLGRLERPSGTRELIAASDIVIAGNSYLAEYAHRYNPQVLVIPTSIDTAEFPVESGNGYPERCVIGWIGSHSTEKYIHSLGPVLQTVARAVPFTVKIVGANRQLTGDGLRVTHLPWRLDREREDYRTCDIGVYPLWADEWARGKCGWKALQFMAAGVPVVASAIGANKEIIQDGVNGLLATSEGEWCEKLRWLIEDPQLRRKIGAAGRETVEKHYSLAVNGPKLVDALQAALRLQAGRWQ